MLIGLLLVSLAFNWYYLTGGFHADDLLLINLLREDPLPMLSLSAAFPT